MPDVAPQYQAVLRVTPGELSKGIGALREPLSTLFVGESHHHTICGHSMLENPIVAAWVPCITAILKNDNHVTSRSFWATPPPGILVTSFGLKLTQYHSYDMLTHQIDACPKEMPSYARRGTQVPGRFTCNTWGIVQGVWGTERDSLHTSSGGKSSIHYLRSFHVGKSIYGSMGAMYCSHPEK